MDPPGTAVVTPSVLVIDRSACGISTVSPSVAESLPGVGSGTDALTLAVLDKVPVAPGSMVALTV